MVKAVKPGRLLKTQMIREYEKRFQPASSFFVTNFNGLTNKEIGDLKRKLKAASARYIVVKKTLCKSAFHVLNLDHLIGMIEGSCAVTYTEKDPVAVSKVLVDFLKSNEKFMIKGGLVDGEALSLDSVKELASMPSREVLLARLVWVMNSPVTGFVTACSGVLKKLVYAINEIKKKREENKEERNV
jgi:large subunit ribosomal protein L10